MDLKSVIQDIPNFPKEGIIFRDIMPVLAHPQGLQRIVQGFSTAFAPMEVDCVVGIESRGFIIGAPLAFHLGCGFVPVRKPGKLPGQVFTIEYALEYGTDRLEMQKSGIRSGSTVLIIDDVIATGGTAAATTKLVAMAGGKLIGYGFVVELLFLEGRSVLSQNIPIVSLVTYA